MGMNIKILLTLFTFSILFSFYLLFGDLNNEIKIENEVQYKVNPNRNNLKSYIWPLPLKFDINGNELKLNVLK